MSPARMATRTAAQNLKNAGFKVYVVGFGSGTTGNNKVVLDGIAATNRLRVEQPGVRVLFVGINPGIRSSLTGHHFAGFSNRFWKLLFDAKLVPERITFQDDDRLPEWGFGITNLIARPSPGIDDLTPAERAVKLNRAGAPVVGATMSLSSDGELLARVDRTAARSPASERRWRSSSARPRSS